MWIDKAETWALADELGVLELIRTEAGNSWCWYKWKL
jgi:7-cyano-7-deazaguanine synthase in queuosine biosynthesis